MSKILRRDIARVITRISQPGRAKAIAAYLLQTNRTSELRPLLRDVAHELAEAGTIEVLATSARPLSAAVSRDIRAETKRLYPNAKHITIIERHDPVLVGGTHIQIGDYELDLSVHGRIARFKAAALKASV